MLDSVIGTEGHTFCHFVLLRLGLIVEHNSRETTAAPHLLRLFANPTTSAA